MPAHRFTTSKHHDQRDKAVHQVHRNAALLQQPDEPETPLYQCGDRQVEPVPKGVFELTL